MTSARRVVAPITVKRGSLSRMERADGPLPITMSSAKSSMAGYSTSSTRPAQAVDLVDEQHIAGAQVGQDGARSPARSMAGPEVILMLTPISLAITCARVVLPSPGGP